MAKPKPPAKPLFPIKHEFTDFDADTGGYSACVIEIDGGRRIEFSGLHPSFGAARDRAKRLHQALLAAGETGIKPHVHWHGERPAGFPRNGVTF